MDIANKITKVLIETETRLLNLYDDLSWKFDEDEKLKNELIELFGGFYEVENDFEKVRRECIETSIVHFPNYNLYIKEVAIGECHYKDVVIDGYPYEIKYFIVEPKEIKIMDYINDQEISI